MFTKKTAFLVISFIAFQISVFSQIADVTEGCNPLEVQFDAPSGTSNFYWEFGDGVTSVLENPAHIFTSEGTFTVNLYNGSGGSLVASVDITVLPKPVVIIEADPYSGCAPLNVSFQNSSLVHEDITVTGYSWDFGDGNSGNGASVSHNYANAGVFSVSLALQTDIANCGVLESFGNLINVSESPIAYFTTNPNPPSSCEAPLTVSFTNGTENPAGLTFAWDFGNGATSSAQNPPAQTYSSNGSYIVTLTATDAFGCSRDFQRIVTVGPPQASFIIPDTVCFNVFYDIINTSDEGTYNWNFGPGAVLDPDVPYNPKMPRVKFIIEGDHEVSLTVTSPSGQCTGDTTISFYIQNPDASFVSEPTFSCSSPYTISFTANNTDVASYLWTFPGGATSTEQNPEFTYNSSLNKYCIASLEPLWTALEVTSYAGCTTTFYGVDTLFLPTALFMPDTISGCAPLTVLFCDKSVSFSPIIEWEYDFGDGSTQILTTSECVNHTFTEPGEYNVTLSIENENGCVDDSYEITIYVGELLDVQFESDVTEVCPGETVHFTSTTEPVDSIDGWHFDTDGGSSFHCFGDSEMDYNYDWETGNQDVTLTVDFNGCFSTLTVEDMINVNGPIAKIDYMVNCETPYDIMFSDSSRSATSILWDFGDGSTSTDSNPIHHYDATGDYEVILTAENDQSGCPPSYDTTIVYVKDIVASFEIDSIICKGDLVYLNAADSEDARLSCYKGYKWEYSFDRPWVTADEVTPKVFGSTGPQTVVLIATDINGCSDTLSHDVIVYGIYPDFSMDDDIICIPGEVNFTDQSTADAEIISWDWEFGDNFNSDEQNPSHEYTNLELSPGVVFVNLTVTDEVGCSSSISKGIDIYKPVSTISTDATLCVGDIAELTATDFTLYGSNLTFSWDFGDGNSDSGQSVTHTYSDAGDYNLILSIVEIATGCPGDPIPMVMSLQDYPVAAFSTNVDGQDIICYPSQIEFTDESVSDYPLFQVWNFGNGGSGTGTPVISTYGDKGTFYPELTVSTPYGCSSSISDSITLVGPEGNFTISDNHICLWDEITFTMHDAVDVSSWQWDFGDGNTLEGSNPVTHQYTNFPTLGATVVKLILSGINDECEIPLELEVFFHEVVADFEQEGICQGPYIFVNKSTDADIFTWNFGDGTTSDAESPTHSYPAFDVYQVELLAESSEFGCKDTLIRSLDLTVPVGEIVMPNVFTPNNDEVNDFFKPVIIPENDEEPPALETHKFKIFNRWGKLIYDNDTPDKGWDGKYKGKPVPQDVYFFTVEVSIEGCNTEPFTGDVTLLR